MNLIVITALPFGLAIIMRFIGLMYQNLYLDILDGTFLFNLGLLAAATLYAREASGNQAVVGYTSVTIALVTFVGIAIYRIYLQLKETNLSQRIVREALQKVCCFPPAAETCTIGEEMADSRPTEARAIQAPL